MFLKRCISLTLVFGLVFNAPVAMAQSRTKSSTSLSPNQQIIMQGLSGQSVSNFSTPNSTTSASSTNFDLSALSPGVASITVHVVGDVIQPGTYKIPIGTRLSYVLQAAKPQRQTYRFVRIERSDKTALTLDLYRFIYSGSLADNPYLQDNDVIKILGFAKAVRIAGPVSRPGVYEIGSEKTVEDVIRLAGGLTSIYNDSLPINILRLTDSGSKNLMTLAKNDIKSTPIRANDVIIVQSPLNQNTTFDYSLESLPGEEVFYPTSKAEVYVAGAVLAPGAYPYKPFMTVKDYIGVAGVNDNAKIRGSQLIRNNKASRIDMNAQLNPGDMIVVKKKDLSKLTTGLGIVSSILSVTLTVIILDDRLKD